MGKKISLILGVLILKCLLKTQVEVSNRQWHIFLEFRVEVWTRDKIKYHQRIDVN